MNAVILAAGDATRFTPALNKPKCLLEVGGTSLLKRQLRLLDEVGVRQVTIVVGHLAAQIERELESCEHGCRVQLISNPNYNLGSALSLLRGLASVGTEPVLILDADLIYAREVVAHVLRASALSCLPVDEQFEDTGEEVKIVALPSGRVEALGKSVVPVNGRVVGESVGIFKFDSKAANALSRRLALAVKDNPETEYESVIDSLLHEVELSCVAITGLPWIEIDFAEDLVRAETVVWPKIAALEASPAGGRGNR